MSLAVQAIILHAAEDRRDLAAAIIRSRLLFAVGIVAIETRLLLHTVGVGNPQVGSTIPLKGDQVLRHDNQVVTTRLKESPLETIARLTGGVYIPARTNALPLGELFRETIDPAGKHEENEENRRYEPRLPANHVAEPLERRERVTMGRGRQAVTQLKAE